MTSAISLQPAPVVDFARIDELRPTLGRIVVASGGFDPLHPGHASNLLESSRLGDTLIAVVNGDEFLRVKKGRPFLDLGTRCGIVSFLRGVDYVVPFEIAGDQTVCEALRRIRPHVYAKGGDRAEPAAVPEWSVCQELGIEIRFNVGAAKEWSSSDFLRDWGEYWAKSHSA